MEKNVGLNPFPKKGDSGLNLKSLRERFVLNQHRRRKRFKFNLNPPKGVSVFDRKPLFRKFNCLNLLYVCKDIDIYIYIYIYIYL